ncbi:Cytochrome c oxidase caa3 assembly factor [Methyloligella halotolerans]|uniref:Cytochrome c oxidase caa3 assembly factor n=1 Tax=Methyloligella halotolerans TaxID=1177755 RepID=A0A1E2RX03_9HYPH|nr:cytochrome c oxidase assembly protein [Methyloligella halotolerans]ODA66767.1 Cytochrome c oxidase caa3 assembly factor [Methyloligella halotolerans]
MIWNAIPYCGTAPEPGGAVWNLDPILITVLMAFAAAYAIGYARRIDPGANRTSALSFAIGWTILTLALISPLCNLSVALFAARVGQHMILALIAAPLIIAGRADIMLARAVRGLSETPGWAEFAIGTVGFALAVWIWHMPVPYTATFESHAIYWLMHITMIGTALIVWRVILRADPASMLMASFVTGIQMSGIGAILTLAPAALFAVHDNTTWPFGLTPLQDQILGGLIMWVPGGLILTIELLAALGVYLHRLEQRDRDEALSA